MQGAKRAIQAQAIWWPYRAQSAAEVKSIILHNNITYIVSTSLKSEKKERARIYQ